MHYLIINQTVEETINLTITSLRDLIKLLLRLMLYKCSMILMKGNILQRETKIHPKQNGDIVPQK